MLTKNAKRSEHFDHFALLARRQRHTRRTFLLTIARKCVHKHVSRLIAPLFCTALSHDHIDEKKLFINFFASYIYCLWSVWAPVGCISLAIVREKDNVPAFLYLRIAQALIHKGCSRIRWLGFDGYSGKFAYRPIGQRGDPLKIVLYRIFLDIARENQPTLPCTCWVRAVAVLSAISVKKLFRCLYVLRLPPAGCKTDI